MRQGFDERRVEPAATVPPAFKYFIGAAALFIAGCSAFFSVCGLGMLFVGSSTAVMIMASSLEVGKLVAASFLYWFWRQLTIPMQIYMTLAVLTLIGITSLGNYGYLARAYERTHTGIGHLENQIACLQKEIAENQGRIDESRGRVGRIADDGREDVGVVRQRMAQATALFEQSLTRLQDQRKTIQDRRDKDMQAVSARLAEQADVLKKGIASEDAAIERLQQPLAALDQAVDTYTKVGAPGMLPIGGPWIFRMDGVKRGQELREQQRTERDAIATAVAACRQRQEELRAAHAKRVEAAEAEIAVIRNQAAQESARIDADEQSLRKAQEATILQTQSRVDSLQSAGSSLRGDVDSRVEAYQQRIRACNEEIRNLQDQIATTDIGSYRFVARAFDAPADNVVKWLILVLVIVFDPLAVCLAVGFNVALFRGRRDRFLLARAGSAAGMPATVAVPVESVTAANEPGAGGGRWMKSAGILLLVFMVLGGLVLVGYWAFRSGPRRARTSHAQWIPSESFAIVSLRPAEIARAAASRDPVEWFGGSNRIVLASLLACVNGGGFDSGADVYCFAKFPNGRGAQQAARPVILCGLVARVTQPAAAEATLSGIAEQISHTLRPDRDATASLTRNRAMIRYGQGRYMDPEGGFFTFAVTDRAAVMLVEFEGDPQAPLIENEIRACLASGGGSASEALQAAEFAGVLRVWFDAGQFFRAIPKNPAATARYQQFQRHLGFDVVLDVCPIGSDQLNIVAHYTYQADRFNRPGQPTAIDLLASIGAGENAGLAGRLMDRCADTLDFDSLIERLRAALSRRAKHGLQDVVVEKSYASARDARFVLTAHCDDKSRSPLQTVFQSLWQ